MKTKPTKKNKPTIPLTDLAAKKHPKGGAAKHSDGGYLNHNETLLREEELRAKAKPKNKQKSAAKLRDLTTTKDVKGGVDGESSDSRHKGFH